MSDTMATAMAMKMAAVLQLTDDQAQKVTQINLKFIQKLDVARHDSVSSSSRNIEDAGSVRYTRETIAKDPRFRRIRTVETLTFWSRSI